MIDLLEQIEELADSPHNYGDYLSVVCPFHEDSVPSMMVYEEYYNCLACGVRGKTTNLLKKLSSNTLLSPQPIKVKYNDYRNPWSKWTKNQTLEQVLKQSWSTLKSNPGLGGYLHRRGISQKFCAILGIGYREDWFTIPIWDSNHKIIGAVARANAETNKASSRYIMPSGQPTTTMYVPSYKLCKRFPYIYLTFGILDSISLYILGLPSMSTTGGKHLDSSALDEFRKEIRIIPDFGELSEAHKIACKLGWRGKVIDLDYPDNCKDINDSYNYDKTFILQALE